MNCSPAETVAELHVGDEFIYLDPVERVQRRAVLLGRSRGRMVVHFRGCSYIYDLCLEREEFLGRAMMSRRAGESRGRVRVE